MTLKDKVSLLCTHSQKDVSSFIELASSFFLNNLPIRVARNFYAPQEITTNGLKCSIKKESVIRGKRACREISFHLVDLSRDENSSYFATPFDPVCYYKEGKIFVIPDPTEKDKAYVNTIPTIVVSQLDESINGLTEDTEPIVLLYTAFLLLTKEAFTVKQTASEIVDVVFERAASFQNDIPSLPEKIESGIEFNFPEVPNVSIIVEDIESSIEFAEIEFTDDGLDLDITVPDFSISYEGTIPTFEMPDISEPTVDLSISDEALENAKEFIGSATLDLNTVPKGAFWLNDEDPEMVASSVQLANTELQRASISIQSQIGSYNVYKEAINAKFTEFKSNLDAFQAEVNYKIQDTTARIQSFNAELQGKVSVINAKIQKIQAEITAGKYNLEGEIATKQHVLNVAKTNLEQNMSVLNSELSKYQSSLQGISVELQNRLQEYSVKVNENIQIAQLKIATNQQQLADINHLSTSLQGNLGLYSSTVQEASSMYQRYVNELQTYLTSLGYDTTERTGNSGKR